MGEVLYRCPDPVKKRRQRSFSRRRIKAWVGHVVNRCSRTEPRGRNCTSRYGLGKSSCKFETQLEVATKNVKNRNFAEIIEILIKNLNFSRKSTFFRNVERSFMSYGNWSISFEDYFRENITEQIDSDEWFQLQKMVDPFSYRKKLAHIPKFAISCSGPDISLKI